MASVTSLDRDLRQLRLEKYTPAAANEARQWIEGVLGERLSGGDLLEGLKDGVALCKLVNLAVGPPGVKFKKSAMPFVQMENISHFLRACQAPPLNLQQHDMFLTVDLYEQKDPAQVLQCILAFSRAANAVKPSVFPSSLGPRSNKNVVSPQPTGYNTPPGMRGRPTSNSSTSTASSLAPYGRNGPAPTLASSRTGGYDDSGRRSPAKSPTSTNGSLATSPSVSSWSKREHEGATSPAWNIAQYGYMGGASQGNLGIAFGGRRQITSAGPHVPSLVEKEKRRKEEAERLRLQQEEEERQRQAEREAEEARAREEEERRWEEETRRIREEERRKLEEEKRRWEDEERQWKVTEEKRRREEAEAEARLKEERQKARAQKSGGELRGQYLSQYQADQESKDKDRIRQLEKELERARQREAEYERERQGRTRGSSSSRDAKKARSRSRSRPAAASPSADKVSRQDSWSVRDEQKFLSTAWHHHQNEQDIREEEEPIPSRPLPDPTKIKTPRTGERVTSPQLPTPPVKSHRTGDRKASPQLPTPPVKSHRTGERRVSPQQQPPTLPIRKQHTGSRPLPDPTAYSSTSPETSKPRSSPFAAKPLPVAVSRTDQYLASNPAPSQATPAPTYARELLGTSGADERDEEDRRRAAAQKNTKASGWASKSLLEREMELERQRQKEWEEAQQETAKAAKTGDGVEGIGGGIGGRWDVSQWAGYTGGDSQNKGAQGIGAGRRQIVGPRPLPGTPR